MSLDDEWMNFQYKNNNNINTNNDIRKFTITK